MLGYLFVHSQPTPRAHHDLCSMARTSLPSPAIQFGVRPFPFPLLAPFIPLHVPASQPATLNSDKAVLTRIPATHAHSRDSRALPRLVAERAYVRSRRRKSSAGGAGDALRVPLFALFAPHPALRTQTCRAQRTPWHFSIAAIRPEPVAHGPVRPACRHAHRALKCTTAPAASITAVTAPRHDPVEALFPTRVGLHTHTHGQTRLVMHHRLETTTQGARHTATTGTRLSRATLPLPDPLVRVLGVTWGDRVDSSAMVRTHTMRAEGQQLRTQVQ